MTAAALGRAGLDRRVEAVVIMGDQAVASAETVAVVAALGRAGLAAAVVAPLPTADLAQRTGRPPEAGSPLLVGDSRSGEITVMEGTISRRITAVPPVNHCLLERARDAVIARLSNAGIEAAAVGTPALPVATVELRLPADMPADLRATSELLMAHGIPSVLGLAELATSAAREAGMAEPRVSVDGCRVAIATVDAVDTVGAIVGELWRQGVAPGDTALVVETAPAIADGWSRLPPGLIRLHGGGPLLLAVVGDQVARRRWRDLPGGAPEPGWGFTVDGFDVQHERVHEARLALADGRVGTSGAPLPGQVATHPWVLAGGIYDGEGPETHLLTGPVAFRLPFDLDQTRGLRRLLDLRTGVLYEEAGTTRGPVRSVRFSSLADPGTVVLRALCPDGAEASPLWAPADDAVHDEGTTGGTRWMRVAASSGGIVAAGADTTAAAPGGAVVDRVVAYEGDAYALPEPAVALRHQHQASTRGFDQLLAEHRRAWAGRWEDADVVIEGDDELQLATRFTLLHLMGSVHDAGEAAVGARGLTGTSYRGHVFWDADTFVLPFLAATHPAAARAMLEYRLRRLPAAIEAARAAGRGGARFPWESARSGRDVTPLSARDRAGKLVPIRTGQLEDHIVAQVAWAACCYADWSGDDDFFKGAGVRLLVETARYWASRVRVDGDGAAHIYGVVGPDEYHDSVDDNAFTNVMARWNLRRAAAAVEIGAGGVVSADEVTAWRTVADALVDGYDPDTGIYEQFAGFYELEPLIIEDVAPRRPIAADMLLGADRVRGAQVIKQADVLMLHHLVPDEVHPGSLEPNLRFYEPRTAHGSSLSPGIHASLFARARDFDHALEALSIASRIDLDDLTGTTAGGLHLATMGGLWQAFAFGFAGLRPRGDRLEVDPRLPPSWSALEMRVRFRGTRVRVRDVHDHLTISADRPARVSVGETTAMAGPRPLEFDRRGPDWELTT